MCYGRVDARRVAREFAVHVRARRTLRTDLSPPPHLSSAFRPRTVDKTHAVLSFHRFIAVQVRDSRARARRTTSGDTAGFARGVGRVARWIRDATRRDANPRRGRARAGSAIRFRRRRTRARGRARNDRRGARASIERASSPETPHRSRRRRFTNARRKSRVSPPNLRRCR